MIYLGIYFAIGILFTTPLSILIAKQKGVFTGQQLMASMIVACIWPFAVLVVLGAFVVEKKIWERK